MAHVLVVDDDADVRAVVHKGIARLGHQVWDVADGAEALELLKTTPFDLIISDVYMADMDGMELLVRIRQLELGVPVIVISGGGFKSREEVLKMAAACGAVATLDKPFSLEQLRDTVEPFLPPTGKA
ncbi:MAG TPA: response regulator [Gemmatimonadales bacterium]|nr:response regulator [Gemmatimonadales bacterium]